MRKAPSIFVAVALIMQVARVAAFGNTIGAGILAPVFAVFLAGVIFVLAYWEGRVTYEVTAAPEDKRAYNAQMKIWRSSKSVREQSRAWLFIFIVIDGYLNLAETIVSLPSGVSTWAYIGAIGYGALPTLAAWGLGRLQAHIDKLPQSPTERNSVDRWIDALVNWAQIQKQPEASKPAEEVNREQAPAPELSTFTLLDYWAANPEKSDDEVAQYFGVSRQAIAARRKDLTDSGVISVKRVNVDGVVKRVVKVESYPVGSEVQA